MKPRTLLFVAGAAFVISFFLPAYSDFSGFRCIQYCWSLLWKDDDDSLLKCLYYSGFVLTNFAFVGGFALRIVRSRFHITGFVVSAVAFFHVLSWLLLHLRETDITALQAGYYLWLLAYVLLLVSQISENRKSAAA